MAKKPMVKYEATVSGAVADAFSVFEELASELHEAVDNAPEGLRESDVNQRKTEAAEALESIQEITVANNTLGEIVVAFDHPPLKRRATRSDRRDEAVNLLQNAFDALQTYEPPAPPDPGTAPVVDPKRISDYYRTDTVEDTLKVIGELLAADVEKVTIEDDRGGSDTWLIIVNDAGKRGTVAEGSAHDLENERDELMGEIQTMIDEAEAVEFPGMMG